MKRIAPVLKAFSTAIALLSYGPLAIPFVLYFIFKLCILFLYVGSGAGALNSVWALFRPGASAEQLSHYPEHLLYMPAVLGRLDIPLEVLILVLVQGATILIAVGALRRKRIGLAEGMRGAAAKYLHLVIASAVASAAMYGCFTLLPTVASRAGGIPPRVEFTASLILGIVVQALFIYSMPFILIEGKPAFKAIGGSFRLAGRSLVESFLLVFLPFVLTVPTLLLHLKPQVIAFRLAPEFLIHVQVAGEVMQLITSYLLIGGVTVFFIRSREKTEEKK